MLYVELFAMCFVKSCQIQILKIHRLLKNKYQENIFLREIQFLRSLEETVHLRVLKCNLQATSFDKIVNYKKSSLKYVRQRFLRTNLFAFRNSLKISHAAFHNRSKNDF